MAYGFNAEGGTKNFNFPPVVPIQSYGDALTLVKRGFPQDGFFLRAESFYNAASYLDDLEGAGTKLRWDVAAPAVPMAKAFYPW